MAMVIRSVLRPFLREFTPLGRAIACRLNSGENFYLHVVGIHGAHGDELGISLADAAVLVKKRCVRSALLLCGDLNVDLLPTLDVDPWRQEVGRSSHRSGERDLLTALCKALRIQPVVPCIVSNSGSAAGEYNALSRSVPFTRTPQGDQMARPALLDFCCADPFIIVSSCLCWDLC